jgi:hypothetical protein
MRKWSFNVSWMVFVFLWALFLVAGTIPAQGQGQSAPQGVVSFRPASQQTRDRQPQPPVIKMLAPGVFEIGGVKILKKMDQVSFPASVNMAEGLLEYLIVGGAGKLHESLLKTDIEPYSLQIALLLLGLEGTTKPLSMQGDPGRPEGDPVTIHVQWKENNRMKDVPIESWVVDKNKKGPLDPVNWVFTGSMISDGVFMAQVEKSIVAVFHDPAALIDNPLPDGASDEVWFVNQGQVPPVGTKVTVLIRKQKKSSR